MESKGEGHGGRPASTKVSAVTECLNLEFWKRLRLEIRICEKFGEDKSHGGEITWEVTEGDPRKDPWTCARLAQLKGAGRWRETRKV